MCSSTSIATHQTTHTHTHTHTLTCNIYTYNILILKKKLLMVIGTCCYTTSFEYNIIVLRKIAFGSVYISVYLLHRVERLYFITYIIPRYMYYVYTYIYCIGIVGTKTKPVEYYKGRHMEVSPRRQCLYPIW